MCMYRNSCMTQGLLVNIVFHDSEKGHFDKLRFERYEILALAILLTLLNLTTWKIVNMTKHHKPRSVDEGQGYRSDDKC